MLLLLLISISNKWIRMNFYFEFDDFDDFEFWIWWILKCILVSSKILSTTFSILTTMFQTSLSEGFWTVIFNYILNNFWRILNSYFKCNNNNNISLFYCLWSNKCRLAEHKRHLSYLTDSSGTVNIALGET